MALAFAVARPVSSPHVHIPLASSFFLSPIVPRIRTPSQPLRAPQAVLERAFVPLKDTSTAVYAPTPSPPARTVETTVTPGESDALRFELGDSVSFWSRFDQRTFHKRFRPAILSALRGVFRSPFEAAYWLYSAVRVLVHTALGAVALLASGLGGTVPLQRVVRVLLFETPGLLEEAALVLEQDRAYVRAGVFRHPWDITPLHRQNNPLYLLAKSVHFFVEGLRIVRRRREQKADTATWLEGDMYPSYYKHTFHFQTDGWVSSASADVYEITTETLFIGRQDAMQRLTLVALSDFLGRPQSGNRARPRPNVVEMAAGTGRLATFVRDNWPDIDYVVSDLSPFYLEKARDNMGYWERTAGRKKKDLGSVRYVQAMAEQLPLEDGSVDVVFAVYLFHELPPSARRAVVDEAARVLKPGGLFVITDSIQIGDLPPRDTTLSAFTKLNEPYYTSYLREDFGEMVTKDTKFVPRQKELSSVSKMLSFVRN